MTVGSATELKAEETCVGLTPTKSIRVEKSPVCGDFAEPSSGLEPGTPLYEGGPWVKWLVGIAQLGRVLWLCGLSGAHLSIASWVGRIRLDGRLAPVAHLLRGRQAARGHVAPAGAKGWLRVSMCQIASASRRARSTWATRAPRCLPRRVFVRW
jgi:hypothetical protein